MAQHGVFWDLPKQDVDANSLNPTHLLGFGDTQAQHIGELRNFLRIPENPSTPQFFAQELAQHGVWRTIPAESMAQSGQESL